MQKQSGHFKSTGACKVSPDWPCSRSLLRLCTTIPYLPHSREEVLQVPGPDACSQLHAEDGARVPLLWCEVVDGLSIGQKRGAC